MFIAQIFTLYPDYFPGPLNKGLYGKAMEKKIWDLKTIDIREYALDKHKTVDDTPVSYTHLTLPTTPYV